jgi:hypothetical protein
LSGERAAAVQLLREVNDRIRERAARTDGDRPTRFVCECGDPECRQTIMLSLGAFDARRGSGTTSKILAHPVE